jgi:hypothetical protein
VSNGRSFRRSLKAGRHIRPAGQASQPRKQPWNKGLAMTSDPSDSTTHRWLAAAETERVLERTGTRHTGKPGRPAILRSLTEEGRERARKVPPNSILQERLRRQENARKRGGRRKGKGRVTQTDMTLAAGMMIGATGKLIAAGGDSSVLLPEEVGALIRFQCATWKNGALVLKSAWLEYYNRTPGERP